MNIYVFVSVGVCKCTCVCNEKSRMNIEYSVRSDANASKMHKTQFRFNNYFI